MSREIIEQYLRDSHYDSEACSQKSKDISRSITDRIKKVSQSRYVHKRAQIIQIWEKISESYYLNWQTSESKFRIGIVLLFNGIKI